MFELHNKHIELTDPKYSKLIKLYDLQKYDKSELIHKIKEIYYYNNLL